jgi:hypothetical protein
MSLLQNQTSLNQDNFFFGSGGGGGGSSTVSQFYTSSISASGGSIINVTNRMDTQQINVTGELNMLTDSLNFSGGVAGGNLIQFGFNQGQITGISSINSAPYPPPGASFPKTSTLQGVGGQTFTNVSSGSAFTFTPTVPMKVANDYILSGVMTFSIGDNTSGLSFQGTTLNGGVVMQSNSSGASFTWMTRPSVGDTTASFLVATTSGTPASGSLNELTITDLGPRVGSL